MTGSPDRPPPTLVGATSIERLPFTPQTVREAVDRCAEEGAITTDQRSTALERLAEGMDPEAVFELLAGWWRSGPAGEEARRRRP